MNMDIYYGRVNRDMQAEQLGHWAHILYKLSSPERGTYARLYTT